MWRIRIFADILSCSIEAVKYLSQCRHVDSTYLRVCYKITNECFQTQLCLFSLIFFRKHNPLAILYIFWVWFECNENNYLEKWKWQSHLHNWLKFKKTRKKWLCNVLVWNIRITAFNEIQMKVNRKEIIKFYYAYNLLL